jgi:hypothetical protein
MDNQLTVQDMEFMSWLDGKDAESYWDKDEKGEKVILRSGWNLAQIEYNRIKGLGKIQKSDLKVCGTLNHRE